MGGTRGNRAITAYGAGGMNPSPLHRKWLSIPQTKKLPEGVPFGQNVSNLTVQGVDSGLGVINVELLDIGNLAQTGDLGVDTVKAASGVELAQPGILVRASHVIVGVVTGRRMTLV